MNPTGPTPECDAPNLDKTPEEKEKYFRQLEAYNHELDILATAHLLGDNSQRLI